MKERDNQKFRREIDKDNKTSLKKIQTFPEAVSNCFLVFWRRTASFWRFSSWARKAFLMRSRDLSSSRRSWITSAGDLGGRKYWPGSWADILTLKFNNAKTQFFSKPLLNWGCENYNLQQPQLVEIFITYLSISLFHLSCIRNLRK